jgi:transposase-like protein/IS1 family transposase
MDYMTCYCRMPRCPLFGQVAPHAQFTWHDWHRQAPRWRCRACRALVSARAGTAYVGIRTESTPSLRGAVALAEGMSIRATGRLLSVDKDTVSHWLPVLGRHCQGVMHYFFRNLHLRECQLDELWTFVAKKEAHLTLLEKLATIYGDAWVSIAFSPVYKLVPAWVVGKRTLRDARRLVVQLQATTDGHIPFFTSDALPHYADALLEVYGVCDTPPRQGTRGRVPTPRRYPPPDLCYAVVVKERAHGRVSTSPRASSTGPLSRSQRPYGRRLSATRSIRMEWSATT